MREVPGKISSSLSLGKAENAAMSTPMPSMLNTVRPPCLPVNAESLITLASVVVELKAHHVNTLHVYMHVCVCMCACVCMCVYHTYVHVYFMYATR